MGVFFFFQAEDGIRDAQESRGLGDVYKRQDKSTTEWSVGYLYDLLDQQMALTGGKQGPVLLVPVSYTHLTLPTIYSV